jgi:CDP-diacylglycerol--glycerol-3-phosphate 3-phosphatidyltransferase
MLAYALTLGRLLLAAGFAACVAALGGAAGGAGATALLLVLALGVEASDLLDGPVARRAGTASRLGGLLDPLCDSISRLTMYFAAALAGWVTLAVPLAMTGRDLVVAYVRTVRAHVGGSTSARSSGKLKAIIQGAGIMAIVLLAPAAGRWAGPARLAVAAAVLAATGWSLIDYLRDGWPAVVQLYRRRS